MNRCTKYKIFETKRFSNDLKAYLRHRFYKIESKLEEYIYPQLRTEPHCGPNIKRLKGFEEPTWRYRVGDWRFFYIVDEKRKLVQMVAASHRKEAYR